MNKEQIFKAIEKAFLNDVNDKELQRRYDNSRVKLESLEEELHSLQITHDDFLSRIKILQETILYSYLHLIEIPDSVRKSLIECDFKIKSFSIRIEKKLTLIAIEKNGIAQSENLTWHRLTDHYHLRKAIGMTKQTWDEFRKPYIGKIF